MFDNMGGLVIMMRLLMFIVLLVTLANLTSADQNTDLAMGKVFPKKAVLTDDQPSSAVFTSDRPAPSGGAPADDQIAVKNIVVPDQPAQPTTRANPAPNPLPDVNSVTNDRPAMVTPKQGSKDDSNTLPKELTENPCDVPNTLGYGIGIDDILTINVVRPEPILMEVTVSPDGTISFPYIGTMMVKGKTLDDLQAEMTKKLGEGYMKYPVLRVAL